MLHDFLSRVFPPDLLDYLPGRKLLAAVVVYGVSQAFGVAADTELLTVPAVPGVLNEIVITPAWLASAAAYYWFPESEDEHLADELALETAPDLELTEGQEIKTG